MQMTVRSHHVEITDSLKEYAESKLSRLDKFYEGITSLEASLKIENTSDESKQQVVEVNILVPGNTIRATEASKDMYASIDMVYDKCEKQLNKYKGKRLSHSEGNAPAQTIQRGSSEKEVLYIPKPMTPEDAVHHMGKQPFLMFRNSDTMDINVLYPLNDGEVGLIEP